MNLPRECADLARRIAKAFAGRQKVVRPEDAAFVREATNHVAVFAKIIVAKTKTPRVLVAEMIGSRRFSIG